jgi:hypothetical protein
MKTVKESTVKKNWIHTIIIWLPSALVTLFFIQNGIEKILKSTELDKVGLSSTQILIVGVILLISTALYLIDRTMILGTVILMLYMAGIVVVHIQKGKPFIITGLIVIAIGYGAYMRRIIAKE